MDIGEQKAFDWLSEEVMVLIDGHYRTMKRIHHIMYMIKDNPEAYEVIRKSYNKRMRQCFRQSCQNIGLTNLIILEGNDHIGSEIQNP